MLQCGDPTGTGGGGPGYSFNDENLAGATYPANAYTAFFFVQVIPEF